MGLLETARAAPAIAGNDPHKSSLLGGTDTQKITPNPKVSQARIELLCEEIDCLIGPMISTLEAALAMREAENIAGFVYGLRCAGAYRRSISAHARDLVAVRETRQ
jgi:hypothetical protein